MRRVCSGEAVGGRALLRRECLVFAEGHEARLLGGLEHPTYGIVVGVLHFDEALHQPRTQACFGPRIGMHGEEGRAEFPLEPVRQSRGRHHRLDGGWAKDLDDTELRSQFGIGAEDESQDL